MKRIIYEIAKGVHNRIDGAGRRVVSGSIWSVGGAAIYSGINILTYVLIAQFVDSATLGKLLLLTNTGLVFAAVSSLGLGLALTKYVSEYKGAGVIYLERKLGLAFTSVTFCSVFLTLVVVYHAEELSRYILQSNDMLAEIRLIAIIGCFLALDGVCKAIILGFEEFRRYALINVAGATTNMVLLVFFIKHAFLIGGLIALFVTAVCQLLLSFQQMMTCLKRNDIRIQRPFLQDLKLLINFGLPNFIAGLFVGPAHWYIQTVLSGEKNGYEQVAVYVIMLQWFNIALFIPTTSGRVILPVLCKELAAGERRVAGKITVTACFVNSALAAVVVLPLLLFPQRILALYGLDDRMYARSLLVVCIAAVVVAGITPITNVLIAQSKMWLGAIMNGFWAAVFVLLVFQVLNHGIIGVSLSLLAAYLALALWQVLFVRGVLAGWNKE